MTRARNEKGYILVTVAVFLMVMLAIVAVAVDVGIAYAARTRSQAAADAAALAGAFTFLNPAAAQPATAQNQAVHAATANRTTQGQITSGQVTAVADVVNRRVTVDLNINEPTFFSKMLGFNLVQTHTRAVAEAGDSSSVATCVKPIFIPNTLGTTDPCSGPCTNGNVLIDASGNKTAYADSILGTQFLMKPADPGNAIAPSDFYVVNPEGAGGGANEVGDAIESCVPPMTLKCQNSYEVKTGNMVNQVKDGFNELIGYPNNDTWVGIGQYRHSDGNVYDTSRSLTVAPIIDLCPYPGFCPANHLPSGGSVMLTVKAFGLFFIDTVGQNGTNKGNVWARLVNVFPCDLESTTSSNGSTIWGVPLRLVRTN